MHIDGFHGRDKQAFAGYDRGVARGYYRWVERVASKLDIDVEGLENLPPGRAMLVGNHAFGWDSMFPIAAMSARLGRRVWVLGDHLWWKVPFVRRLAAAVGVVDGTQENVHALLEADELVLVLPGGLREAVKPKELRYQLLWGHRYGFVRAALRSQAPLVPLASIGTDELIDFSGDAYRRGKRWLGTAKIPLPLPTSLRPRPVHFRLGEPVACPAGPEAADDFQVVRKLRRDVEGALHELIEHELEKRSEDEASRESRERSS